jgi:hydroxypyruvate isomerase
MERRGFIRNSSLAGMGLLSGKSLYSQNNLPAAIPFNLSYAFHDGMFANHAGKDFIDQIKFAHDQGFNAIEDNGMMSRTPEMQSKIGDTLEKLGMRMGVFVITSENWHWKMSLATGKQEFKDLIVKDCHKAVEVAKRCNAKWATVVPGNYDRSLQYDLQMANVIEGLRLGTEVLEKAGLVMVLEPLSDNPDLFLRYSAQTFMVCKAVNSPSCKILFDMYHMQRNEGNIIANMDKCWSEIGYMQIGDNPGRYEPTTGEMNYKNIFKHIYNKGFKGILGMEHGNAVKGKEGEIALIKAYRESDDFL